MLYIYIACYGSDVAVLHSGDGVTLKVLHFIAYQRRKHRCHEFFSNLYPFVQTFYMLSFQKVKKKLHFKRKMVSLHQLEIKDPQKSAPCITAIGYNGVQLWQSGMVFYLKSLVLVRI